MIYLTWCDHKKNIAPTVLTTEVVLQKQVTFFSLFYQPCVFCQTLVFSLATTTSSSSTRFLKLCGILSVCVCVGTCRPLSEVVLCAPFYSNDAILPCLRRKLIDLSSRSQISFPNPQQLFGCQMVVTIQAALHSVFKT